MKRINFTSFLLLSLFLWILTLNHSASTQECTTGKANGSECYYDISDPCECLSQVCFNGTCVECASDSDCQEGKQCTNQSCN